VTRVGCFFDSKLTEVHKLEIFPLFDWKANF